MLEEFLDISKENAEKNKEDVICDNVECTQRGRQRRCYFNIYKGCDEYETFK